MITHIFVNGQDGSAADISSESESWWKSPGVVTWEADVVITIYLYFALYFGK